MTDRPEGLSAEDGGLTRLAENRQMPDNARPNVTLGEVRAALDAARDSRPVGEGLREAAEGTADWLDLVQSTYHAITQRFPNESRDTCEAGMCGDYRAHRDRLRAALADTGPVGDREEGLLVAVLARAMCGSRPPELPADYRDDMFVDDECRALARRVAAEYRRLSTAQPASTEVGEDG